MSVTVMHISDLHRDPTHGIRNGPLLRSLVNDRNRYVNSTPSIASPSLIVVSGDVVYGVPATHPNPNDALAAQYQEAEAFLVELVNTFLEGDRQRLVLVPGNHDVSYPETLTALSSLAVSPAAGSSLTDAIADLFSPHSSHRWSWRDLQLYRLTDQARYNRRFEHFISFYSRFYKGLRNYSLAPEEQFDIFAYPTYGIVIAAFNSCYNNDPLHRAGYIHPDAIAAAARQVDSLQYQGHTPIAVWHHNTSGGPHSDDYMDSDTLQVLIDCGFSIGLHGHQHKPTFVDERFRFATGRKITVLSAGTLCGGHRSLPHGHDRSYNLLELDSASYSASVHQRRMSNDSFDCPVWTGGWYSELNAGTIHFDIQRPLVSPTSANARLSEAEALLAKNDFAGAKEILMQLVNADGIARRLLTECYTVLPYDDDLISSLFPPQSVGEAVVLSDALWELGDKKRLAELLRQSVVADSSDPAAIGLRQKYEARVK